MCPVTTHNYIYSPLKYKDDGRDVVSFIDFITIHSTFPAINAWISYQMYYNLAITATTVCDTSYFDDVSGNYCSGYPADDGLHKDTRYYYFYPFLMQPSLIAFALLFVETSINITYYKDCVFAWTNLCMYLGMFWVNRLEKLKDKHAPVQQQLEAAIQEYFFEDGHGSTSTSPGVEMLFYGGSGQAAD